MRLLPFIFCCGVLILKCETIECQLIKGFLDKVHGTAQKVRQDVRQVLRPTVRSNVNTGNNTSIFFIDDDDDDVPKPFQMNPVKTSTTMKPVNSFTFSQTTSTTKKPVPTPTNSNVAFVDNGNTSSFQANANPTSATSKTGSTADTIVFETEEPTKKNSSDVDGSGKENFSGGCLAGYQRSPDGRCMPVF
ncbi:unnamed protein product [Diatraea saccharalis]|uniref:Uncharacterized protein n=1 Tax=Diatraea saccharalis TaxID=40085 RepID=A0A9N9R8Z2_9NEOP|nr:unnamed protein product [Diatraea saccharalis]